MGVKTGMMSCRQCAGVHFVGGSCTLVLVVFLFLSSVQHHHFNEHSFHALTFPRHTHSIALENTTSLKDMIELHNVSLVSTYSFQDDYCPDQASAGNLLQVCIAGVRFSGGVGNGAGVGEGEKK